MHSWATRWFSNVWTAVETSKLHLNESESILNTFWSTVSTHFCIPSVSSNLKQVSHLGLKNTLTASLLMGIISPMSVLCMTLNSIWWSGFKLELWRMWSTHSLLLLPDPLKPGVVVGWLFHAISTLFRSLTPNKISNNSLYFKYSFCLQTVKCQNSSIWSNSV